MLTKVMIADDHQLIRMALKSLIDIQPDMQCTASCGTLSELSEALDCDTPHVVVCDLHFGSHNALEFIRKAAAVGNTSYIVSSAYPSEIYASLCWAVGASAYVHKGSETQLLLDCIRQVMSGNVDHLLIDPKDPTNASLGLARHVGERLTDREWQIFVEIGHGSSTDEIAAKLFVSAKTIESHRLNIKKKLDVTSKDKLVSLAAKIIATQFDPVASVSAESRRAS